MTDTYTEWGIVWRSNPTNVTWVTREANDSRHADILRDPVLAPEATRVYRRVTVTDWRQAVSPAAQPAPTQHTTNPGGTP